MSWKIQIYRAKPNPAGKDKAGNQPLPGQLLGEWVDLKNVGDQGVVLATLHLADTDFGPGCAAKQSTIYWNGSASTVLSPGETVRVHTGRSRDVAYMNPNDATGVTYHAYAEKGSFVLNNDCGDKLNVWWKGSNGTWYSDDQTSYSPRPPEGAVLQRVGDKLMVVGSMAGAAR